jgi:GxxExxY protein
MGERKMNRRGAEALSFNELTQRVIGACTEVHRNLGPGLLESAYEECLCYEFALASLPFIRQKPLPLVYKGIQRLRRIANNFQDTCTPQIINPKL